MHMNAEEQGPWICSFYVLLIAANMQFVETAPCKDCKCFINGDAAFCNGGNLTEIPKQLDDLILRVIDLSDNTIASLAHDSELMESRFSLQQLTLRNNLISNFPPKLLTGMSSLNEFDISWNLFGGNLTARHFVDTKKLDYLSLAHNEITCIQDKTFASLKKLTELDVSYNRLTSQCLPRDTICDLENLIVLRVSNNDLRQLFMGTWISNDQETGYFSCLRRLTNIQASNCGIETVSRYAFRNLIHLTSLDLSDNYIRSWAPETLQSSTSLVYLDLGNNYLRTLPSDFVKSCPSLSHLSLRNNELRTVDYQWLSKNTENGVDDLESAIIIVEEYLKQAQPTRHFTAKPPGGAAEQIWIDWSGNPWLCGCQMLPFIAWLAGEGSWLTDVDGYHDVICYDPAQHRGSALLDLYVTGMIDVTTVRMLIDQCVASVTSKPVQLSTTPHFELTTMPEVGKTGKELTTDAPIPSLWNFTEQGATTMVSPFREKTQTNATGNLLTLPQMTSTVSQVSTAEEGEHAWGSDRDVTTTTSGVNVSKMFTYHTTPSKSQAKLPHTSKIVQAITATVQNDVETTTTNYTAPPTFAAQIKTSTITPPWTKTRDIFQNESQSANKTMLHRVDKQEKPKTSYVTIVVLCVVADIVMSFGLFLLIRKWCTQKNKPQRWATVVPISSLPTHSSSPNDMVLTPVQT
uniref:Leucine-rich repeat-containing protein 70-like n=1 Tax=Phallusia mammillata TaxID=59560 RepID=A0A6F9DJD1_9ASCI|nr:leucine-rich repeat-containing protein 70-like [Phallusia mammillata]